MSPEDWDGYEVIRLRMEGSVLFAGFDRPQVLNAFAYRTLVELERLWSDVASSHDVDCVVLHGHGGVFSAGGDLQDLNAPELLTTTGPGGLIAASHRVVLRMLEVEQPIIAAVQRVAAGLAANLALLADVLIMADDARLGDTHVRIGLAAGDSGTAIWPLVMPLSRAKEYLLLGDWVTASEARSLGLTRHVVPSGEVLAVAGELAARFAAGAGTAIRLTKRTLNQIVLERVNTVMTSAALAEEVTYSTADYREGYQAFLEKRSPRYTGT